MNSRPNILLVMTDQHRGDALGCDGHPDLLTPNLDALAARGTRFSRAYSTCPSCIPARRSLLTGQFPATNGLCGFLDGVPITSPSLPSLFKEAGYQTALVGRSMHQTLPAESLGYETVDLASGYEKDAYHEHLCAVSGQKDGLACLGLDFNGWTARPWPFEEALHPTNYVINQSLKFLETRDPTKPFFLTVSLYAPHPPLCPPAFYMDRYLRRPLRPPAIGAWAGPPPGPDRPVNSPRVNLHGEGLQSCLAAYYGMINHLDDQISRLWMPHALHGGTPFDPNEMITVFLSDHGEMLGDHHYFRKCEPYEGSARIPLLIAGGGLPGQQVTDAPVCLEDVLPTLLDLAKIEGPSDLDGRSLAGFLRKEEPTWRSFLHGEHSACYSADQAHHFLVDPTTKYIWRAENGHEQLFNLSTDPQELENLTEQPEHQERLILWRTRLMKTLAGRPEGFVENNRLIAGRPYPGT